MEASIELAELLFKQNKYQETIDTCNKILAANSNSIEAIKFIAKSFLASKKMEDAQIYLNKALNIKPNDCEAIKDLGNMYQSIGDTKTAQRYYQKAISIDNSYTPAISNLGAIKFMTGERDEGLLLLVKATKLDPKNFKFWVQLTIAYIQLDDYVKAEIACQKSLSLNRNNPSNYLNMAVIFQRTGKLEEAEKSIRKAIKIKPDLANYHYTLAKLLTDLGKFNKGLESILKSIKINPNFSKSYYLLSCYNYTYKDRIWEKKLFSDDILNNTEIEDRINFYFARANVFHKKKDYYNSSLQLQLANKTKLNFQKSIADDLIQKSKLLFSQSDKLDFNQKVESNALQNIFIVGMPRSGSTLLESIISINNDVHDLGETNILEESYIDWINSKNNNKKLVLNQLYRERINNILKPYKTTTNKYLYNYQYTGIIAKQIINSKIIHCFRNPLDNILSIYRAHFASGIEYSSSLVDCARVYLDQEEIMSQYKKIYKPKIYNLNYDLLVTNPDHEIKSLINWLGWEWDDSYLSPHLNTRSISTASNVQVRAPINSQSIGGWKNYSEMLKPAINFLQKTDKYRDFTGGIINIKQPNSKKTN